MRGQGFEWGKFEKIILIGCDERVWSLTMILPDDHFIQINDWKLIFKEC